MVERAIRELMHEKRKVYGYHVKQIKHCQEVIQEDHLHSEMDNKEIE